MKFIKIQHKTISFMGIFSSFFFFWWMPRLLGSFAYGGGSSTKLVFKNIPHFNLLLRCSPVFPSFCIGCGCYLRGKLWASIIIKATATATATVTVLCVLWGAKCFGFYCPHK